MTRAFFWGAGTLVYLTLFVAFPALSQERSLSVTVTPPLIQLSIGPGEVWRSALKIVNNNTYEVTYYASPVDFEAEGEEGRGKFIPIIRTRGEAAGRSLGEWITISPEPIVVPRGGSTEVPYVVKIPANASPGGHYAAILVGTRPGSEELKGPTVRVASFVSSLLFVRIKGETVERGRIREFMSEETHYETPEASFLLRFENTGNTHLRPVGDVVLYNMWGKERGRVAINPKNNFGNVLPKSTRSFEFSWKGEESVLDIGRYSAIATLAYGDDSKQHATATAYFWVIPTVPVVATLGSILFFIVTIAWLIRRYIRRALALEKTRLRMPEGDPVPLLPLHTLIEPIREGVVDLRSAARGGASAPHALSDMTEEYPYLSQRLRPVSLVDFLQKYSLFFFFIALTIAGIMALWLYFESVLTSERSYDITDIRSSEENSAVENKGQ